MPAAGITFLERPRYEPRAGEGPSRRQAKRHLGVRYPGVAPVAYVNNRITRRIDIDPVRGPLVTQLFERYASGQYSLKALARTAAEIGLRHWRRDRRLTVSEMHRLLKNPIYTGDFRWLGTRAKGSHDPLESHRTFDQVQAVLGGKPRPRDATRSWVCSGALSAGVQ